MRALIGVSDRTNLIQFARGLLECGVDLLATDGTRKALAADGIDALAVSDITGFPEMLDGRVKTLHPAVHAGILARRDKPEHMRALEDNGFAAIDLVVVNLYPFNETVARGAAYAECLENIDIGGPTMIRAAAKNSASVAVVVSPSQYDAVLAEMRGGNGLSSGTCRRLAAEALAHTAAYDTAVATYLAQSEQQDEMRTEFTIGGGRLEELRYGENPHQRGAVYSIPGAAGGVARSRHVQGPALSFTNWLDSDAAWRLVSDFEEPAAAVIKHTNPCGFAIGATAVDAYTRAFECDSRAAFGGVVAVNRVVDLATAEELAKTFLEIVICPGIDDDAAARLAKKERLRVLVVETAAPADQLDVRTIDGGLLVQTLDRVVIDRSTMTTATRREPTEQEWTDLLVAWRVCRHVKSNTVVIVKDGMAVGVGAGQMSRVEAAELAVHRAGERVRGAAAASDAFFPMPDGLETLTAAGVVAVIQPGGSKKDPDVIASADNSGAAMVMAGERHFRH